MCHIHLLVLFVHCLSSNFLNRWHIPAKFPFASLCLTVHSVKKRFNFYADSLANEVDSFKFPNAALAQLVRHLLSLLLTTNIEVLLFCLIHSCL